MIFRVRPSIRISAPPPPHLLSILYMTWNSTIFNKKYLFFIISGLGQDNFLAEGCGYDRPSISTIFKKFVYIQGQIGQTLFGPSAAARTGQEAEPRGQDRLKGSSAATRTGLGARRCTLMTNFIHELNIRCMYKIDKRGGP